jgi:signal transduction histidine kinase
MWSSGVTVKISDAPVILFGDRRRLVEIWQNLIENAAKFMGGQVSPLIEIGVERAGRETVFFVRDNGIGIEPPYHEKVFGLFEKLDVTAEGTGLGLALVKRIVEHSGGTISVESEGHGRGATFRFTIPNAIAEPGEDGIS